MDVSAFTHNRNLQILATQMYKVSKGFSPPIITGLFKPREEQHYNLRSNAEFTILIIETVYHGSESILFAGPKILSTLPDRLKNANSLQIFKSEIKELNPENHLCLEYAGYAYKILALFEKLR